MLNQVPLLLSFLAGGVAASDYAGVLNVKARSPRSWDVVTNQVLGTVKLLVLHSWIPGPHQVVEENACCDNALDGLGLLLHRAQENLEPIGKDAEGIFYDPPGSGKPVVQDALWSRHTPEAVRLHHVGS